MSNSEMKAVVMNGKGGPEVLSIGIAPMPEPGAEDIVVRVFATALNRADTLQRMGLYPPPPGDSKILGLELAGEVVRWGASVTGFSEGDKVFGLVGGGGYAEYALIDHKMAMPLPEGWSFQQGAAVPEVYFTANETIFGLGKLQAGESVLIHAGGSGVGTAAIQMCSQAGAKVYFTAGSDEKVSRAAKLGKGSQPVTGINYKSADFQAEILKMTDGKGVDVILDFIGGDYLDRNLSSLNIAGRLVIAALMGGATAEIDLAKLLPRRLQVFGSVMRSRPIEDKRAIAQRFQDRWLPLLKQGVVAPIIDSTFPLHQAREAHEYMEANRNFGKIILDVQ